MRARARTFAAARSSSRYRHSLTTLEHVLTYHVAEAAYFFEMEQLCPHS
jgi:hypothetical protein